MTGMRLLRVIFSINKNYISFELIFYFSQLTEEPAWLASSSLYDSPYTITADRLKNVCYKGTGLNPLNGSGLDRILFFKG
jgi:hypothetical protein